MNNSVLKSKTNLKKENIVDSVSATELLQALHTLQHISILEDQQTQNLNISFSQKYTFDHSTMSHLNKSIQSQPKFNKPKINQNKMQKQNNPQSQKMNFQFYMSKKQMNNKVQSNYQIINHKNTTQNIIRKTITPKKLNQTKTYSHNKSISPLSQRPSNSSMINKPNDIINTKNQDQLKSTTFTPTKTLSKSINKSINKEIAQPKLTNKMNKENQIQIQNQNRTQNIIKKTKLNPSINQLSIHQRNKQFLKHKNQKIAKLSQQIQDKKKQEEKQWTFKPKILTNNSHIKPKYNDLCASRQYYDKTHKRCKAGKQNIQNSLEDEAVSKPVTFKNSKKNKEQFQQTGRKQLDMDFTSKMSIQGSDSRAKNTSEVHQKEECNKSMVKKKYKNSKFNILLDLIQ